MLPISPVEHPKHTFTLSLFYMQNMQSIVHPDVLFLEWQFLSVGLMKLYFNQMDLKHTKSLCGHTTNSFHCLDITFIQDTNFQYSAGQHSDVYIVQVTTVYAPSPRETNTYLMFLPTQYELILIIFKSKFPMARDGQAGV